MAAVADRSLETADRHATTWDRTGSRYGPRRIVSALALLVLAGALLTTGWLGGVLGGLLVVDVVVMSLPWRVPRTDRSASSLWFENLAYLAMPLGAAGLVAASRPSWLAATGSWWWYALAPAAGAGLVVVSGLRLRALVSGELAFLLGPRSKGHATAHAINALVGPPGEEVVFRGPVLFCTGVRSVVLPVLGVAAFVARHHLAPQADDRLDVRALGTQLCSALLLVGLTIVSGSLYPALVAHLVNNVPQAVLELQRGWGVMADDHQ